MPRFTFSVVGFVLLLARPAAAEPLAVPLVVSDGADVGRHAAPARASVPLPQGRVRDPGTLWLATAADHPAPLQARALERWPDGSIRWLLLDFLADVPAGGHATCTLREHPPAAVAAAHVVREEHDGMPVLDAGPIRVSVEDGGGAIVVALHGGRQRVGPIPLPTLAIGSDPPEQAVPERVTVETDGPVRTELLLTARYAHGLTSEMRVAVFAGQPWIRVQYTLTSMSDQHYLPIRSLAFGVPGRFTEATCGIGGGTRTFSPLDRTHEVQEDDPTSTRVDGKTDGRADGWIRAAGDGVAITLVAPTFWQEYPKAFRVDADRLVLDLFAGATAPVRIGSGAAKTHEFWLSVEEPATALRAADLAVALGDPLVAIPPAAWTVASRALPQALAPDRPAARDFLARLAAAFARYREHVRTERWDDSPPDACNGPTPPRVRVGLYGLLNWGDWQFPGLRSRTHGCEAWGNLEYDLPQVLALGWVATGSPEFFDGLVAAARHYRDVDVIHHAPGHPDWVGMNHPHKSGHFAFEAAEKVDLGHTWTEGLVTFYRLTGEVRALEAARGIADALALRVTRAANPRQYGWPMIALVGVWDATGDARYREAAMAFARQALAEYRPTPAAGDWKMGILADGIAATHAATGDAQLRHWLIEYADALVAEPGRYQDPRYALPLGYLAALTGDSRYAGRARAAAGTLKLGAWGKPLAAMGRTGFRLLAPLDGIPDMAPPGPPRTGTTTPPVEPPLRRGPDAPRRRSAPARRAP